jgi:2-polyprenyl-3-methyl-5-hydroxy-6-metoxy-1,4-benzoquinol methylase
MSLTKSNPLKWSIHKLGRLYIQKVTQSEAEAQTFSRHNERPVELAFVFNQITRCAPRTVLDVGTGVTALPALLRTCGCVVTAIDNVRDYWSNGMVSRHWHVIDDDITTTKLSGPFDMVTCISVLEHIKDHAAAVSNMMQLLRPGGHLVLAGPYTEREYVEDCYRVPGADELSRNNPYICRSYSRVQLDSWLSYNNGELIQAEYWRTWTGRHWSLGQRMALPEPSSLHEPHTHACFLIRRKTD